MVCDMGEANRKWAKLAPPPRLAAPPFRWRWLVHCSWACVLVGSCIFGGGCLFSLAFALNTDLLGACRLVRARREAPGVLERIENLHQAASEENSPPLWTFRYRYSFRLPDGSPMQGTSYAEASSEPRSK